MKKQNNSFNRKLKRVWAAVVAGAMIVSSLSSYAVSAADAAIIVTPFEGQEFYYGQTKTFQKDEHYSLSREPEAGTEITWKLEPEKNEVGEQKFSLTGNTAGFALAGNAPTVKVKNLSISEKAEDIATVNKAYMEDDANPTVNILAPEGYLIADAVTLDAEWDTELEIDKTRLQEGDNTYTYYLRSNRDDNTRKAIDTNPKSIVIKRDSIPPVVTDLSASAYTEVTAGASITSSELGSYYYIVVSENYFQNKEDAGAADHALTSEEIRKKVESNEGITGYGRIDKDKQVDINIQNLKPETDYVLYVFLIDKAGNESEVKQVAFTTEKISLAGEVTVAGEVAFGATLTATPHLTTIDAGDIRYQWYRVKVDSDAAAFEAAYDEAGDDGEDDTEEDDEDDEDSDDEDSGMETESLEKMPVAGEQISPESGTLIEGATSSTYKITKEDIGYRLLVEVSTSNASKSITGVTGTFVPKLMPSYTLPKIARSAYQPTRKLSVIKLPEQWSWVDDTIVPAHANAGYRARFVPTDTKLYRTVIVRVKVPVSKRKLKKSMVKVKSTAYTGKAIKDNFKVKDKKKKLNSGTDYKALYKNNKKLGKATVILQGKGNYKGTVSFTYKIVKKSVSQLTFRYNKTKAYNGKGCTPNLVLMNTSVKLEENVDYTVEYKNNMQVGKAAAIVRGIGNYKGKKTIYFNIVPGRPAIRKVKKKKGSISFTLSRDAETKGYYIYVSTAKSFAEEKTQQYSTTGGNFGMGGLAKGIYYIRVKAYSTSRGKLYTSAYSKVKKVKVK